MTQIMLEMRSVPPTRLSKSTGCGHGTEHGRGVQRAAVAPGMHEFIAEALDLKPKLDGAFRGRSAWYQRRHGPSGRGRGESCEEVPRNVRRVAGASFHHG